MKKIKKSFWRAYWKLHDKKKMLVARLKGYLDGLPPKTRRRIVLAMLAAFAVLALYTFGKAVYEIGTEWCAMQCKDLISNGVPAVHFYTMGKTDNIVSILKECF